MEEAAICPVHPGAPAVASCTRCGTFVCGDCQRFYDYQPLCPACFERRSHKIPASSRARWAMILGLLGMVLVVVPFGIPAVVLAHSELTAIANGQAPAGGLGYARAGALMGWLANLLFALVALLVGLFVLVLMEDL